MTEVKQNGVKLPDARVRAATPGDEIVICGVSGKFPNAENVAEFARKLYNKVRKSQKMTKKYQFNKKNQSSHSKMNLVIILGGFGDIIRRKMAKL